MLLHNFSLIKLIYLNLVMLSQAFLILEMQSLYLIILLS